MKLLFTIFFALLLIVLSSCTGIGKRSEKSLDSVSDSKSEISVKKKEQAEPIIYDKNDLFWEQKQEVDRLLPGLANPAWEERETTEKNLADFIVKADSSTLDYFILQSLKLSDPEINFRAKNVLKAYFQKTVYDPDRKKGFIGLQLQEQGGIVIRNERYRPIRIVLPQDGFPGKKAGIQAGDLILGVDGKVCREDFTMNDFIMYIASLKPGTEIKLVLFNGNIFTKKVKLTARPNTLQNPAPKKSKKQLFNTWYQRRLLKIKKM